MTFRSSEVVGALVTIGDEILLGDIVNGNARHIASALRARGFRLDTMITVGDREEEIVTTLCRCLENCRFLIVTGGLGPTDDDRTNAAAARALARPLAPHPEYMDWLKKRVVDRGRTWTEYIGRMAELPEGAVKLGVGMAGFFIQHENIPCYFLPGVPEEMETLLAELVIPDLEKRFPDRSAYVKRVIRVRGLFESEINRRLEGLDASLPEVEIGYLPQGSENWVTLFTAARTEQEAFERIRKAEEAIIPLLGSENIIGRCEEPLEMAIGRLLRHKGWTLATAESCTGGLLAERITAVSGASDYFDRALVTYSNRAKMELLDVPEEMLMAHGAVSEPVALAMAEGARKRSGAEAAIAITGIAGPTGGSAEKPVGTVFMACATPGRNVAERHLFSGSREQIRQSAAQAALALLRRELDDTDVHSH